jgi:hypothetical protein
MGIVVARSKLYGGCVMVELIRIERVDVNDGGQAIIGNVRAGSKGESE